jgi:preprotein translocase subunit SecE
LFWPYAAIAKLFGVKTKQASWFVNRLIYEGDAMKKIVQFVKESYAELKKVIWPGRDDVISSVKVVIISTIIVAAILGLVDVLLLLGIQAIF